MRVNGRNATGSRGSIAYFAGFPSLSLSPGIRISLFSIRAWLFDLTDDDHNMMMHRSRYYERRSG
jgi:hypothetical protein